MKMFVSSLAAMVVVAVLACGANAQIIVDNYITQQNGDTTGAVGNFRKQSFTPNVAGLGVTDTVAANSPLPASVLLNSATFLRATAGNNPDGPGAVFIDVYQGIGDGGTYLGSSLNSNNVDAAAELTSLTWNFGGISLNSALEHALVFSSDAVQGAPFGARLQVARDAGGGFGNSYGPGGSASNFSDGAAPTPFDTRFQVNMSIVPEPASFALAAIAGALGVAGFRKRRVACGRLGDGRMRILEPGPAANSAETRYAVALDAEI